MPPPCLYTAPPSLPPCLPTSPAARSLYIHTHTYAPPLPARLPARPTCLPVPAQPLTPQSVLSWQRVRIANMMAASGSEWVRVFGTHNSGTYNNQYMVVDTNRFVPHVELQAGLLWVAEQLPGMVEVGAAGGRGQRRQPQRCWWVCSNQSQRARLPSSSSSRAGDGSMRHPHAYTYTTAYNTGPGMLNCASLGCGLRLRGCHCKAL